MKIIHNLIIIYINLLKYKDNKVSIINDYVFVIYVIYVIFVSVYYLCYVKIYFVLCNLHCLSSIWLLESDYWLCSSDYDLLALK